MWALQSEQRLLYDGMEVVQERDASNAVKATNLWAGSIGGLLSRKTFADGQASVGFYHYDGSGNVTGVSDASQNVVARYRYDAWGNTLSASGPQSNQPFRFSTKAFVAAVGLYDYGFRFYDSEMGRWVNRDPIREDGGLNLYGFCANDPINCVDLDGYLWREVLSIAGGIIGAPLGGILGSAAGAGLGSFIGSWLDGECITDAAKNGLMDAGFSLLGAGVLAGVSKVAKLGFLIKPARALDPSMAEPLTNIVKNSKLFALSLNRYNFLSKLMGTKGVAAASISEIEDTLLKTTTFARTNPLKSAIFGPGEHEFATKYLIQLSNPHGAAARHELIHLAAILKGQTNTISHEIAVQFATTPWLHPGIMLSFYQTARVGIEYYVSH